MDTYDVVVVGGGIAGSVAARFSAAGGLSTLLIERRRTPRNKPCSGIQFPYFEKLLGEKAPPEVLCQNALFKVEMITPTGKVVNGRMRMLNFWRSTFDSWLNRVAAQAGAEFRDEHRLVDFHENGDYIAIQVEDGGGGKTARTRYLIGTDGMNSVVRRKLRPGDFRSKGSGAAINYYFEGEARLDPNTLYMFYNRDFSPLMFAWVYLKDDWWVVGTGADTAPLEYAERFLSYVQDRYALRGEMVKREGFSSPMESSVYLGHGSVLLAGDAAGLVDLYRGLGMDNAALSARLAVKAILRSQRSDRSAVEIYERLMKGLVGKIRRNEKRQAARYSTNEELERSLSTPRLIRDGLLMLTAIQVNRLLPPERVITLPL